jgi:hypothetical protein
MITIKDGIKRGWVKINLSLNYILGLPKELRKKGKEMLKKGLEK